MRTRRALGIGSLAILLGAAAALLGQPAPGSGSADWNGEWELTTLFFGVPLAERLRLEVDKGRVTGTLSHRGKKVPITGVAGTGATGAAGDGSIRFEYQGPDGSKNVYEGRRAADGSLAGRYTSTGGENWGEQPPSDWTARRAAADRPVSPRTLDFEPTGFSRVFSASVPPVLRIWPGDTVRTRTVDAAGVDEKGQTRVLGGNPQTGPFYVEGAMPGDVIAVHVRRLRINRATAISDNGIVDRALTNDYAAEHKDDDQWKDVVWRLNAERGSRTCPCPSARCSGASAWRRDSARRAFARETPAASAATWTFRASSRARPFTFASRSPAPCSTSATAMRCRATASSTATRSRRRSTSKSRST
jgi:hypothetical protein